jgi:hypothetical protein
MQKYLIACAILVIQICCWGQRVEIKPLDFKPLTSLPWLEQGQVTVEEVLKKVFLETNADIRYPLLVEYFKILPVEQLSEAFELSLALEGAQQPEDLVSLLLPEWAQRDPTTAWDRTQKMLRLKGPNWLDLDRWGRPKIEIVDRAALAASPFWLEYGLETFPEGIDRSNLPLTERRAILTEFAARYIEINGHWPHPRPLRRWSGVSASSELIKVFAEDDLDFRTRAEIHAERGEPEKFEIVLRRWLVRTPADAPLIMKVARNVRWGRHASGVVPIGNGLSDEWLLLWSTLDRKGSELWGESLEPDADKTGIRIKGLLLGLVAEETRQAWLAQARSKGVEEGGEFHELVTEWARWDPTNALAAAVAAGNADLIEKTLFAAADGWAVKNACHHGLGVIQEFNFTRLRRELRDSVILENLIVIEQLGAIDVGEAARYGLRSLLATGYPPREDLVKLFAGDDAYSSDSDMIDRTFCALRAWAVVRPEEMKAWIAKQDREDMRKALTWLLENPWGPGRMSDLPAATQSTEYHSTTISPFITSQCPGKVQM